MQNVPKFTNNRFFVYLVALMMEAALGVDAAPLLAMQNEYDMQMAERNESIA